MGEKRGGEKRWDTHTPETSSEEKSRCRKEREKKEGIKLSCNCMDAEKPATRKQGKQRPGVFARTCKLRGKTGDVKGRNPLSEIKSEKRRAKVKREKNRAEKRSAYKGFQRKKKAVKKGPKGRKSPAENKIRKRSGQAVENRSKREGCPPKTVEKKECHRTKKTNGKKSRPLRGRSRGAHGSRGPRGTFSTPTRLYCKETFSRNRSGRSGFTGKGNQRERSNPGSEKIAVTGSRGLT